MSRNLKLILIILAGILVLVGALAALSCEDCAADEAPDDSGTQSIVSDTDGNGESSGFHLHHNDSGELLVDGEELSSLRLISDKGDYLIRPGDDGELTIECLSGLLLETDFIEMTWYNAMYFGYSYSIHTEDREISLADYGLEPPQLTIECTYADGSFYRLYVGSELSGSPNVYYFRMDGRNEIFINEFDGSFFQGNTYWLSDDIFGDDVDDVTIGTIKLTGSAFEQETVIRPHESGDKSDPYYGSDYIFTQPVQCRADDYLMTLLIDEMTELVADEAVCAFPTAEDIAAYGLDKPYAVITHQRNGTEHVLRLAKRDASTLYAKADGVECIFEMSADVFYILSSLTPDLLRAPEVHVRYFDAIETIRIRTADEDYLFRLERTPLETDETLFEYRAYCGDTRLTLSYYRNLLEVFNGATSVSYGDRRESDTPALTVTIGYFDGFDRGEEVIRYYPAGTRRYLVEADGINGIVVGQMWVDKLLESARLLSENEAVTP